jgi:hypothetical protein
MSEMLPIEFASENEWEICRAKMRYPNKKSARSMINYLLRGHRTHGRAIDLRTYCCPLCHAWHLTKQVKSIKSDNLRALADHLIRHRFEVRQRRKHFFERRPLDDLSPYGAELA